MLVPQYIPFDTWKALPNKSYPFQWITKQIQQKIFYKKNFWTSDQDWDYNSHYYISFGWSDGAYVYHDEHYDPILASCWVLLNE